MVGPFPLPGRAVVGGIEAVSQNLVRGLSQLGADVTVITDSAAIHRPEEFRDGGVDYRVMPIAHRSRARLSWFALERRAVTEVIRRLRGRLIYADAFFPLLLLSVGHYENIIWTWQIQFVMSSVLIGSLFLLIIGHPDRLPRRSGLLLGAGLVLLVQLAPYARFVPAPRRTGGA